MAGIVITIGGVKGGSGKSTIAVNFATACKHMGLNVALLDADPKPASRPWAIRRDKRREEGEEILPISCYRLRGDSLHLGVRKLQEEHQIVIVDCGGFEGAEQRAALAHSKIGIFPFTPSIMDTDTAQDVQSMLQQVMATNDKLICLAVASNAPSNPFIQYETDDLRDFLKEYPIFKIMDAVIRNRKAYRDTAKLGIGVVEFADNKARTEMQTFTEEVLSCLKASQ